MKTNQNAILKCAIYKDDTDEILKQRMISLESMLAVGSYKTGFLLTISGYANDSRELWQIPEMKTFAERLVKMGFISLLEVSTMLNRLKNPSDPFCDAFGAFEIWLLSKGLLKDKFEFTTEIFNSFLEALDKANNECLVVTAHVRNHKN